jgi:Uma2 family endonuclease
MATAEALMTAEEFGRMPDDGRRTELVRGRIVELPPTNFLHGLICCAISFSLRAWVGERHLGRVVTNDSGIVTRRDPDTLRGADVAYYSYARLPQDSTPKQYPDVAPELVVEVRSPSDRWRDIHAKVAEYLNLGVLVVCVIDPEPKSIHLYYPDQPNRTLGPDDELTFPDCLPDFRVVVRSLFE